MGGTLPSQVLVLRVGGAASDPLFNFYFLYHALEQACLNFAALIIKQKIMKQKIYFLMLLLAAMFTLSSCSSDDDKNTFTLNDQFLYVGDSVKLASKATIANDFVAFVSKSGYLHGFHVDTTTITCNGQTAKVTVRGHYNGINVQTDWTLTPEQLVSKQSGELVMDETDDGIRLILYRNVGIANYLGYSFKDNKMFSAIVYSSAGDMEEVLKYLQERYIFVPEEVDSYTFVGRDAIKRDDSKTTVMVQLNTKAKTEYMLQTLFISTGYMNSFSKAKSSFAKAMDIASK